jgi:DNA polymerase III alpha subunit
VIANDHGYYPTAAYVDEARRAGIRFLPWEVNESRWRHIGGKDWIRPGFQHVQGVRSTTVTAMEAERKRNGPFHDLPDFRLRLPMAGQAELEALARVGAFDSFGLCRTRTLAWLAQLGAAPRRPDSVDLFQDPGPPSHLRTIREESLAARSLDELRLAGYSISMDPLEPLERLAHQLGAVAASRLGEFAGKSVRIIGVPVASRVHRVRDTGEQMLFLSLSDKSGIADTIFWPPAYKRYHAVATGGGVLSVRGMVTEDDDTFALEADHVEEIRT